MPKDIENEKKLIKECKNGNREAFNKLVVQYQDMVVNFAYGMLSNSEDAYDAAQEIFIRVFKSIKSFEGKSSFSTWLFRISSNVCKDFLRKRQAHIVPISMETGDFNDEVVEIEDTRYTPEGTVEKNETQMIIRKALSEIKDDYREVITYCDLQERSYEETAKILGCPVGTVKSRLSRARIALKEKLTN